MTIDEREESFKVKDLERRVFVPQRNRVMCEAFIEHAQRDPGGRLGKSIVVCVNQDHATEVTKIFNALQPGVAVTITSRISASSEIAKEFRDGKRTERVAVSVDMLTTGYNCKDLLNVVLMRPVFSPTDYIQIKGRGTRLYTFRIGNTEYEKKHFFLLDFCGVAEYFEDEYDYTEPLKVPSSKAEEGQGASQQPLNGGEGEHVGGEQAGGAAPPRGIPVWEGRDVIVFEEVRIVGPQGEKVDVMTFRGSFERDVTAFAENDTEFKQAAEDEDDDAVETIVQERFFHRPEMYYSADKLVKAYGVPAPTPAFVYNALGVRPLPTRQQVVEDAVDSLSARFNLRYNEQQWLSAAAQLVADDPVALAKFVDGDLSLFDAAQFTQLGGLAALAAFEHREEVFEALRDSVLVRQTLLGNERSA